MNNSSLMCDIVLATMRDINFSWTPYYYNRKYGAGKRIFSVMAKRCKVRLFIHCSQILFMAVVSYQQFYNSFLKSAIEEQQQTIDRRLPFEESILEELLTFDHYRGTGRYNKRINIFGFLFTIQGLILRLYCISRRQQTQFKMPVYDKGFAARRGGISNQERSIRLQRIGSISNKSVSACVQYVNCLTRPGLTLVEQIRFCLLGLPLGHPLEKLYPVLRDKSPIELLKFDIMAINYDNEILCQPIILKITYSFILILTPLNFSGCLIMAAVPKSVAHYYGNINIDTMEHALIELVKCLVLVWILFLDTSSFVDAFFGFCLSLITYNRVGIYHKQLTHLVAALSRHNIDRFESQEEGKLSPRTEPSIVLEESVATCSHSNSCKISYLEANNKIEIKSVGVDQKILTNTNCSRYIVALHQLLFEFEQLKAHFTGDMHLGLFITFFSLGWFINTMAVTFSCSDCEKTVTISVTLLLVLCYLLSILLRIVGMALISMKVNHRLHSRTNCIIT